MGGEAEVVGRVADPDPDSIGSVDPDLDTDPGGQKVFFFLSSRFEALDGLF